MATFAHYITNPSSFNTSFFRSRSRFNLVNSSSLYKPTKITMSTNNQSYWTSINDDVEAHIEQALSGRQPACVIKPMHHLAFAAPRSASSALCVAACEMVGGHRQQAIAAASALHLMHSAAFAHENLPLSDKPMNRPKTKPNVHHAFDANIELLTADALFPLGYELLADQLDDPTDDAALSEQILRVVIEISTAMGSQGMVDGQYIQQLCMGSSNFDDIHHVCEKKEGRLYARGAACGAILGGATNEEIEKLRRYGFYVGMMNGIMMHGVGLKESKMLQMVQSFRHLAHKELENFQDRNIDTIHSLMDGFVSMNDQASLIA